VFKGGGMRQLFISYARENKPDVEALIRDLGALGHQTWVDSTSLRGGQTWWEEILRRIAESDVFVAIVSAHRLNSVACKRELEWALALNKPVLPVAVERLPDALPRALLTRQIIYYSKSARDAAFALAGALGNLPTAAPLPKPLPEPPPAPLSYLFDLVDPVAQPEPLTREQQHQILIQLQPALRSADPEERKSGRYVLEMFSKRNDLFADVARTLAQLGVAARPRRSQRVQRVMRTTSRPEHLKPVMLVLGTVSVAVVIVAVVWAGVLASKNSEITTPTTPRHGRNLPPPYRSGDLITTPTTSEFLVGVPNASDQAIYNAQVGDCIYRVGGARRSDDTQEVTVTPASCWSSYATDKVIRRTDNPVECTGTAWVESRTYSPPVVLCLAKP
jgi:hypothetical protein